MKLFDDYEAVKFIQENMIFITKDSYLYYIYDSKRKSWNKYENRDQDRITVKNYQDITEGELIQATDNVLPKKETDFYRLIPLTQLNAVEMKMLLEEDYKNFLEDENINHVIQNFFQKSEISYKHYLAIRELLDRALKENLNNEIVLADVKMLCLDFMEDIYLKTKLK